MEYSVMKEKKARTKKIIKDCIDTFFDEFGRTPSVREIGEKTGIPIATVQRYLVLMNEDGDIEYNGRYKNTKTPRITLENKSVSMPVVGSVACGTGEEEEEHITDYIRMPEMFVGKGDLYALEAKGESMIDAGIYPGDYVIVKKQQTANEGDLVVALFDGKSNLKEFHYNDEGEVFVLKSYNQNKKKFPDLVLKELKIQGIVVGCYHKFN